MLVEASGTQTATLTTEHTLSAPATAKTRVLIVDTAALQAGETVTLQVKAPVLAAGTVSVIEAEAISGVQSKPHFQSPPFVMPQGGEFTLTQVGGTGRAYPWAVITLD